VRIKLLLLAATLLATLAYAQERDPTRDERVEVEVVRYLNAHQTVPVVVVVGGRVRDAREVWQGLGRQIRGVYGEMGPPPNSQGEFFAELNRFGLMLLLGYSQVEAVYLTFEATRPGEDDQTMQ